MQSANTVEYPVKAEALRCRICGVTNRAGAYLTTNKTPEVDPKTLGLNEDILKVRFEFLNRNRRSSRRKVAR